MKYTVSLRLIGDEVALNAAIAELEAEMGLRVHVAPPRKGRKDSEWIAYGTLAVPRGGIVTGDPAAHAPPAVTGPTIPLDPNQPPAATGPTIRLKRQRRSR